MKKRALWVLVLAPVVLAAACTTYSPEIQGHVIDDGGIPIANVVVLARYEIAGGLAERHVVCRHVDIALTGPDGAYAFPTRFSSRSVWGSAEDIHMDGFKAGYVVSESNTSEIRMRIASDSRSRRFDTLLNDAASFPRWSCGNSDGSGGRLYLFRVRQLEELEGLAENAKQKRDLEVLRRAIAGELADIPDSVKMQLKLLGTQSDKQGGSHFESNPGGGNE